MITDSTINEIREAMPDVLRYYGVEDPRRPFRCLNTSHEDKHPSMSYDTKTKRVKCFSCGWSGDDIDLVGMIESVYDFNEAAKKCAAITSTPLNETDSKKYPRKTSKPTYSKPAPVDGMDVWEIAQYACNRLLEDDRAAAALDYMHKRGFDDLDIADYCIGWVPHPSKVFPAWGYAPECSDGYICLPFPENGNWGTGEGFCPVRRCNFRPVNASTIKEVKQKGQRYPIWHEYLLRQPGIVYITEGIFDAMAAHKLLDVEAAALCGLGCERLFQVLNDTPEDMRPTVIMALDSDRAGIEAACKAVDTLHSIRVNASAFNNAMSESQLGVYGRGKKCKDFNDLLIYNRKLSKPRDYK